MAGRAAWSIQKKIPPGREMKLHPALQWAEPKGKHSCSPAQVLPVLINCSFQALESPGRILPGFLPSLGTECEQLLCPAQQCWPCRQHLPAHPVCSAPRKWSPSTQLLVNKAIVNSENKWQMLPALGYFYNIWVFPCTQLSFLYLIISVLRNPVLPKQPPHHSVHWLIFLFEEGLFVWPQYFPFFVCFIFFPLAVWNDLCCRAEIVLLSYLELKRSLWTVARGSPWWKKMLPQNNVTGKSVCRFIEWSCHDLRTH